MLGAGAVRGRLGMYSLNPTDLAQTDRYPHPHEHFALCPLPHLHRPLLYSRPFHHRLFPRNHLLHESVFVFSEFGPGLESGFDIEVGIGIGIGFVLALGILLNLG